MYIGETSKSFKFRLKQHLYTIKKFVPFNKFHNLIVAKHFNLKNHTLNDLKTLVFKKDFNSDIIRKNMELDLINFFNINTKRCLNEITSNNTKSLCFL